MDEGVLPDDFVVDCDGTFVGETLLLIDGVLSYDGEFVTEIELVAVDDVLQEIDGEDVVDSESNAAVGLFDIDCETLLLVVGVGMKEVVAMPLVETE